MKKKFYTVILIFLCCLNLTACAQINGQSANSSKQEIKKNRTASTIEPDPTETPEVVTQNITKSTKYSDSYRTVEFLGLKVYKNIKGKKYTDTPKNGYKYLVLFLDISNESDNDDYINYNCISAKVDGKKIEHTYLLNNPCGYSTLLTTIKAKEHIGGFIVWEIPQNWKKFEFSYNGWENINQVNLKATFTPNDLKTPEKYNPINYQ